MDLYLLGLLAYEQLNKNKKAENLLHMLDVKNDSLGMQSGNSSHKPAPGMFSVLVDFFSKYHAPLRYQTRLIHM